jgi:hypothetical protein
MFAAYRALINVNVISCRILSPHEQDMMTTTRFLLDNTALFALCYLIHDFNRNSRRLTRNLRGVARHLLFCYARDDHFAPKRCSMMSWAMLQHDELGNAAA